MSSEFPKMKGFSYRNIRFIKQWYTFYGEDKAIWQQVVAKLGERFFAVPWGHHQYIINRCKTINKAIFYLNSVIENNWSRAILLNFLDTDLYERKGKAVSNFSTVLPKPDGDLAQELTKDPYCFDFTDLRDHYNERQFKDALIDNIEKYLIELGTGFAYMGREYRLEVGSTEQYLDMLFYQVQLHCYVVIEVKTTEFSPAYIGQIGTYTVAVDHILRREGDNKTIGLLICKTKDNVIAKYALESSNQPIGISEFELSKLFPEHVEGTIPSIEEIEYKLKDLK